MLRPRRGKVPEVCQLQDERLHEQTRVSLQAESKNAHWWKLNYRFRFKVHSREIKYGCVTNVVL